MSNLILPPPLPIPNAPITTRLATLSDIPFIDAQQKANRKALGFLPTQALVGKIEKGEIVVASGQCSVVREEASSLTTNHRPLATPIGYCIFTDRYLKRDELGAIYQMCVVPEARGKLVAATLLREVFARSAYGTKLFCCWCAQDLAANKFWEAMGFVALAYRVGGSVRGSKFVVRGEDDLPRTANHERRTSSSRIHLFWQKRTRANDTTTPWWFPAKTDAGAIGADRIVLPVPPGMRWDEEMPQIEIVGQVSDPRLLESSERGSKTRPMRAQRSTQTGAPSITSLNRPTFGGSQAMETTPIVAAAPKTSLPAARTTKPKADPALVAKARELRDRYLEHVNAQPALPIAAKYCVERTTIDAPLPAPKLLAA